MCNHKILRIMVSMFKLFDSWMVVQLNCVIVEWQFNQGEDYGKNRTYVWLWFYSRRACYKSKEKHVKIDEVNANLLPQQKYEWLRNKLSQKNNIVGFVGDGLNDAPSLTLANVGFCMGLKGNSASIEASDIVIANDNIQKIPQAIEISKYTRKIVWQNILFSALIKICRHKSTIWWWL